MIIQKTNEGWRVIVPETDHNSEFSYDMPICTSGPEYIGKEQTKLARQLALLLFSMENFFKSWKRPEDFQEWERKNKMNWNDWFHTRADELREDAWALWREWGDWHFREYGWNAY